MCQYLHHIAHMHVSAPFTRKPPTILSCDPPALVRAFWKLHPFHFLRGKGGWLGRGEGFFTESDDCERETSQCGPRSLIEQAAFAASTTTVRVCVCVLSWERHFHSRRRASSPESKLLATMCGEVLRVGWTAAFFMFLFIGYMRVTSEPPNSRNLQESNIYKLQNNPIWSLLKTLGLCLIESLFQFYIKRQHLHLFLLPCQHVGVYICFFFHFNLIKENSDPYYILHII